MIKFLKSFFSKPAPTQFSSIQVKYLNNDISIFYQGKKLRPNVDYYWESIEVGNYLVKFSKVLNKKKYRSVHFR